MGIQVRSKDLKYAYLEHSTNNDSPKFIGKPDKTTFYRYEVEEVIPMLEKVLEYLRSSKKTYKQLSNRKSYKKYLHTLEDMIRKDLPRKKQRREEVFDWLRDNFSCS
ncbi:hypothetical protein H0A36_25035 [Endozoicomonas sp. SM1973]|uniref:Uncharacterized protein n=1 Tax=Spartinivicinus marinus TaxID=2994442 RepID=A0A853IFH4_9GAMM|nr:hypothetical protein [Spartinivicinus marinus]MCX4028063.1 hypothetical protein [Spartinivicinus marinus]NYZ69288.1 hypothetical protein [Spartinivicinus marinus]